MGKIVFLDIDGTLCDDSGAVPESAKQAIKQAHKQGHRFFLCTGRSKAEIPADVLALPINGMIGAGGGYCEVDEEVILHHVFDAEELKKLVDFLEENGVEYYLESNQGLFASANLRTCLTQQVLGEISEDSAEGQEKVDGIRWFLDFLIDDPARIDFEDVNKVSFVNRAIPYEDIHSRYIGNFHMMRSTVPAFGPDSGEIGLKNINKKTAIESLLAHIGREKKDCLAFGDGENDIPMFEAVETGIAMANAHENLKAVADEITFTSNEDGIAHMLEKLCLA